jgi:hypothetical protein
LGKRDRPDERRVIQWEGKELRLALLSDIHGNIAGLDAAFAYGHYHGHHVISLDGKLLVNVVGVGIGDDLAAFTLVDYDDRWVVRQYQVPYDGREEK